jgi:hypothetical protein
MPLPATEKLSRVPIEDRVAEAGYYSLTILAHLFGRSLRMVHYAAVTKGWLGKPRTVGKRRLWSLAAAEYLYDQAVSPEQVRKAVQKARSDTLIGLAASVRKLRDQTWLDHLRKHGITNIEAP